MRSTKNAVWHAVVAMVLRGVARIGAGDATLSSTPTRVNLRPPAEADIQQRFGVTPPSVHQMILALERAGLIRRQPRASRSIEVLVPPDHLPVLEMPAKPVKTSVPRYYPNLSRQIAIDLAIDRAIRAL